jgi:hypothetical protein
MRLRSPLLTLATFSLIIALPIVPFALNGHSPPYRQLGAHLVGRSIASPAVLIAPRQQVGLL